MTKKKKVGDWISYPEVPSPGDDGVVTGFIVDGVGVGNHDVDDDDDDNGKTQEPVPVKVLQRS